MILSTTPTIEGHPIREYRGVVTGETIIGTNFVKDFFASVRDVIGGRSGSYESTLREAKDTALREMADRAASLGCNAIVGIDLDYETVGKSGSMLMVTCIGLLGIILYIIALFIDSSRKNHSVKIGVLSIRAAFTHASGNRRQRQPALKIRMEKSMSSPKRMLEKPFNLR